MQHWAEMGSTIMQCLRKSLKKFKENLFEGSPQSLIEMI